MPAYLSFKQNFFLADDHLRLLDSSKMICDALFSSGTILLLYSDTICRRGIIQYTVRGQSNVWRLPKYSPSHRPVRGEDTLVGSRGGGGSIVRKTPNTALYSISMKYKLFRIENLR